MVIDCTSLRSLAFSGAAIAALVSPAAWADTSNGTIAVALNVTNACVVNGGSSYQANVGLIGTIQFPDQPGIFGDVDGELVGSLGTLQVQCSPDATPVLTIGEGANDDNGKRYLATGSSTVPYRLFSDSARTDEIAIGDELTLGAATNSAITVPIYARVNSGGEVLAAGSYVDTVQVLLSW